MERYADQNANRPIERQPSTLDQICNHILNASRATKEMGMLLNAHADAVFGTIPDDLAKSECDEAHACGALGRLFQALDDLDRSIYYTTQAAERNCTLA